MIDEFYIDRICNQPNHLLSVENDYLCDFYVKYPEMWSSFAQGQGCIIQDRK